eukprot:scaffold7234_cov335-Prasinococcus_capsulatus_cf.AAC.4
MGCLCLGCKTRELLGQLILAVGKRHPDAGGPSPLVASRQLAERSASYVLAWPFVMPRGHKPGL